MVATCASSFGYVYVEEAAPGLPYIWGNGQGLFVIALFFIVYLSFTWMITDDETAVMQKSVYPDHAIV